MSCNGCRVLRKGCGDSCILRPCLDWIESSEAQGNATVFVAKFFGRATLMSFISGVPESQRPALFKSLLFEACGRTINPLSGSVGLLGTGNWHLCQVAVATVLRGGSLCSLTEVVCSSAGRERVEVEGDGDLLSLMLTEYSSFSGTNRRKRERSFDPMSPPPCNPSPFPRDPGIPRPVLSSVISGDSVTALGGRKHDNNPPRLLNLFI